MNVLIVFILVYAHDLNPALYIFAVWLRVIEFIFTRHKRRSTKLDLLRLHSQ